MSRLDRLGLALLAGGLGLAAVNLLSWWMGLGVGAWRPPLSGMLMVAGLALLAVGVIRGLRERAEDE
ncbi:MAG: hypothetical protein AAFN13_14185 [Bacteroidota bacterium]